ncbi:14967_t:CDS:2, partial [Entrophospora sp. SA101]
MNTENNMGRKLVTLTNIKKKELCEYKIANPTKTNEQLEKNSELENQQERVGEWPQLEDALAIWIDNANRANCTITGVIICQKAKEYATRLGINEFSASKE